MKFFQNWTMGFREEDFLKMSSCPYSAKSLFPPPPMAAMFFDGSKFREQLLKKVTQGTNPVKLFLKLDQRFQRRRFLKNSLKNSILLLWQPEILMELNSFNNFCRASFKEHSCKVLSRLAIWFWRRRFLKKLLTDGRTDDDRSQYLT